MSDYLPDEVVVQILERLPVKSLIRFRCVSKSWNSLITTPAFIDSHLNQSILNNNSNNLPHPPLILRYCVSSRHREQDLEHYKLFHDNEAFEECTELEFPVKSRSLKHFRLVGSENGVICLTEIERFILWNPSIRKDVTLPTPCIIYRKHGSSTCHEAFGFDPRTNDYKVVRIVFPHSNKESLVEVYSVSTGSWRLSSASFPALAELTDWRQPKACLKGSVHFVAGAQRNGTFIRFVLSFDLRDEVFREMIFADNMVCLNTDFVTCVFSGSLALLCYDRKRESGCCSIWVMKEYGVVDSWVKQFTIDIAGAIEKVLGFRKNGHIILETPQKKGERAYWELFSYDPESQQATKMGIHGEMHTFCVDTYRENLVLLNVVSRSRVTKKRKNSYECVEMKWKCEEAERKLLREKHELEEMKRNLEEVQRKLFGKNRELEETKRNLEEAQRKLFGENRELEETKRKCVEADRLHFRQKQWKEKVESLTKRFQLEMDCPKRQPKEKFEFEVRELQGETEARNQELTRQREWKL